MALALRQARRRAALPTALPAVTRATAPCTTTAAGRASLSLEFTGRAARPTLGSVRRPRRRLVVLIDGGCPLCRRTARLLHTLDWLDRLAFADGVDGTARERWAPGLDEASMMREMYVVDETGTRHAGYDGYWTSADVDV